MLSGWVASCLCERFFEKVKKNQKFQKELLTGIQQVDRVFLFAIGRRYCSAAFFVSVLTDSRYLKSEQ
jgi:hypothetical protein